MVLTRRFWILAAVGIPIAAVGRLFDSPYLVVAYDLVLLATAAVSVRLAPSPSNLRLRRQFDPVLSVRTKNRIKLIIENEGLEPIRFRMRDEAPASCAAEGQEFDLKIDAQDTAEVSYSLTPRERGADEFRGSFIRIQCPLGLAEREGKLDTEEPVRIYPNVLALKEFDLLKQTGRLREIGIRKSRIRGLGTEFESLRHYAEGDDYRKIDWKASARRGDLVVRQYEQERNQAVVVAVDIGRHMLAEVDGVRKLDHVLDSLLMLINAAARAGDQVGLLVYADTVRRYIPPHKGRNQVGMIIEALHDLVAEPVESDPVAAFAYLGQRWKRRSLLVNFTDYEDGDRAKDLVTSFGPMARRHLALLCRVMDPRVDEVAKLQIVTLPDMYKKAAATFLLEDRRDAQNIITSARIHTLDAEPQELAAKLVSYYFSVKERGLL